MKSKAQMGSLQAIIIALVVIGLILGIGFLVMEEFKGTIDDYTGSVVNETVSGLTVAGVYLEKNYTSVTCLNSLSISYVLNGSAGVVTAVNYTWDATTGLFKNATTGGTYSATTNLLNVTYTYQYGKDSCGGIVSTINATKKIPTWLSIVVILLIVGILLAIVFSVLPRAGGGISFGRGSGGTVAEI